MQVKSAGKRRNFAGGHRFFAHRRYTMPDFYECVQLFVYVVLVLPFFVGEYAIPFLSFQDILIILPATAL